MKFETLTELIVLNQTVLAAKFSPRPYRVEFAARETTAILANGVVDSIISLLENQNDRVEADRWRDWRVWEHRLIEKRYLDQLMPLVAHAILQQGGRVEEQHARNLIAPFIASDDEVAALVVQLKDCVDARREELESGES